MYLDIGTRCPISALFDVPHQSAPMRFQTLCKEFPEFVKLFDGQSKENTLLFYWKWNKREKVFEFIDDEAEEEVAELMGVKILEHDDEDVVENRQLTEEEVREFKEQIQEMNNLLKESGFKK